MSLSHKVIGIAAGEAHTLALTGDGAVFSWGRGTMGRLGIGREEDQPYPAPIRFDASMRGERPPFVGIAAGAYHSLAVADDGTVWAWGYNNYGQLGRSEENSFVPRLVDRFLDLGPNDSVTDGSNACRSGTTLRISSVKAGGMMSLAIDSLGGLWVWGNCPQPTDADRSEFSLISSPIPLPVWDFHGRTVVKVACGNEHVVALVSSGETFRGGDLVCYSWGNNNHGQLGLGDTENRGRPQLVTMFNEESAWSVYEIACGAFHTALLTQRKFSDEEIGCKCWTFGLGENGQLGHGTTASSSFPEPVNELPRDAILISLDCGLFHTCVVSGAGDVWSWGMEKGLGLCLDGLRNDHGDALLPLRIQPSGQDGSKFVEPVLVACGSAHTILVAGDGHKLWAWGRGRSGVLGRGNTADSIVPCVLMWPPLDVTSNSGPSRIDRNRTETRDHGIRQSTEVDQRSSAHLEKMQDLHSISRLALMEQYATVLHIAIFGRPFEERDLPKSLRESNVFDIKRDLESTIESADDARVARMEVFYRSMHKNVENEIMKRQIRDTVKECLRSMPRETQIPRTPR